MPCEFIWFDLGYTLLYKERERLFAGVLARFDIDRPLDEIDRAFHAIDKLFMREYPGRLGRSPEEFMPLYIGLLCGQLGIHADLDPVRKGWMEAWKAPGNDWQAYPFVHGVLDRLAAGGYRLGVISNWDPGAKAILDRCCLLGYFEVVVISSEVGVGKPDERIFRIALEKAKVEPSRCLYLGDNYYDDAIGAAKVGMASLIVNRFGGFGVEELAGQDLVNDISGIFPWLERTKA